MMNITEPTITESFIQTDTNHYITTVYDNEEYKCTVLVTTNIDNDYITNNIIASDTSTKIAVDGQYI